MLYEVITDGGDVGALGERCDGGVVVVQPDLPGILQPVLQREGA